jgi:two-component system phosphate regulon sensor histidine kinase PhoR
MTLHKRSFFWPFFGSHILILCVSIGLISLYAWQSARYSFDKKWVDELELQARMVSSLLPMKDGAPDLTAAEKFLHGLTAAGGNRFTLILADGKVVGDTEADSARLDTHINRPEVVAAMKSGRGVSKRYSASLGMPMMYLAVRLPKEGTCRWVLRVSVPYHTLSRELNAQYLPFLGVVAAILLIALVLSYTAALRIIGPVLEMQNGLTRIGCGELGYRLPLPAVPHLDELARSINETADRLQTYIRALDEERTLRKLILENMVNGVVALDSKHKILNVNQAACGLLRIENPPVGKMLGEVTRVPELLDTVEASEKTAEPVERELTQTEPKAASIQLRATALMDSDGKRIGTLLMLRDVTRIRQLERIRQDFVSNVSHELRTPVTSIKGFAETLLGGAIDNPETAKRFVGIISRQANQLEAIIHDLLELSRLESGKLSETEFEEANVHDVIVSAMSLCRHAADAAGAEMAFSCDAELTHRMHAGLVEQAVTNLIANAVKYGKRAEPQRIDISATEENGNLRITVSDNGPGIAKQHLDRLFERFYRVDMGRSRELGGTGLGLAIVKHIALIHGGSVQVESVVGEGSAFSIFLPDKRTV